ncbi:MAG: hypothetical protein LQ348_004852 [Seirophora lacunosa]|nr:MAG: hypothetical protein LQ348_004852 [Seirophora lacunosa]
MPANKGTLGSHRFLAFTDICLAVIPISIVRKLQLSLKKKVGLSILLGMGILYEPHPLQKAFHSPGITYLRR